ncbi:MAG: bifunctional riboflavin kinase/FAD synthetase [Planctomycetaceae bacterium]|nr:bifunctional riboflavin kinase/FAD synthetase [Planctomycetaceae bacterium]
MKLLRSLDVQTDTAGGFLSIGNFDGVHRGHRHMLQTLVAQARSAGAPSVVMTFEPHPIALLAPDRLPPRLTTLEQKAELLEECGVDVLVAYPTDHALLALTPDEFFQQVVQERLNVRGLVEGPNFCFGKDRAGDVELLRELCDTVGLSLTVIDAVKDDTTLVSSSLIRSAIAEGRLSDAVEMLGHPYQLTGIVESGAGRGRSLGFSTANLTGLETMLPSNGVYAGRVELDGKSYAAAVHLGPNPTFAEQAQKLEVHLIDFEGDLYGQPLSVGLIARVRDTMQFAGVEALKSQLNFDLSAVRDICKTHV